jgi:hypothetical protein
LTQANHRFMMEMIILMSVWWTDVNPNMIQLMVFLHRMMRMSDFYCELLWEGSDDILIWVFGLLGTSIS